MKRELLRSSAFIRAARRFIAKEPQATEDLPAVLALLERDAFDPRLRTHKLRGKLAGSWACSAAFDLRVVFRFVDRQGKEAILLQSVGTHEEVY